MSDKPLDPNEPSLLSLPEEVLLSLLVRTPSSTHPNLKKSCRTLNTILTSPAFRRERSLYGYEVGIKFLQRDLHKYRDDDDEDDRRRVLHRNDVCQIRATILVDGKTGGRARIVLVPRPPRCDAFRDICWLYGGRTERAGLYCCDESGGPMPSVRDVVGSGSDTGGFVCIESFEVDSEYGDTGYVGAMGLRALLCSPKLIGRWSLAVYICSRYLLNADYETMSARDGGLLFNEWVAKEIKRNNARMKKTMLKFFRAGFQLERVLGVRNEYCVVAAPAFFDGVMMSDAESLDAVF